MRAPGEKELAIEGRWVEGNAKEGIPSSRLTAPWLQDFWESHKTLIERAGRTVGEDGSNDLYLAIQALLVKEIAADIDLSDYLTIARAAELYGYHIIHIAYDINNPSNNNISLSEHPEYLNRTLWLSNADNDEPNAIVINLNYQAPIGTRFSVASVNSFGTVQAISPATLLGSGEDLTIFPGDLAEIISLGDDGWRMHKRLPLFKDYEHPNFGFGYSRTSRKVWRNVNAAVGKRRVLGYWHQYERAGVKQTLVRFESSIKDTSVQNSLELYVALNQPEPSDLETLGNLIFENPLIWFPQNTPQVLRANLHTLHEHTPAIKAETISYALAATGNVEADWVAAEIQETT